MPHELNRGDANIHDLGNLIVAVVDLYPILVVLLGSNLNMLNLHSWSRVSLHAPQPVHEDVTLSVGYPHCSAARSQNAIRLASSSSGHIGASGR